jgi:DNA-binding transcriptional MerR regulator/effector-binding domain-containing protein
MLKIGEFSRLAQVSVRMLRHYDDLGLLRPAQVDTESGYRYYTPAQLADLHRLLALKDLGFSLEEIRHLLAGGLSPDEIRGMLKLKRAELRQQLDDGYARLQRIESRLASFEERSGDGPEVVVRRIAPLRVASARAVLPGFEDGGRLRDRVRSFLEQAGIRPPRGFDRGHLYIYHDPDYRRKRVDTEVAFPLPDSLPPRFAGNDGVMIGILPEIEAASIVHRGDVWTMGPSYGELGRWIVRNGWRIAGPNRLHILQSGPDPSDHVREILWPIERGTSNAAPSETT